MRNWKLLILKTPHHLQKKIYLYWIRSLKIINLQEIPCISQCLLIHRLPAMNQLVMVLHRSPINNPNQYSACFTEKLRKSCRLRILRFRESSTKRQVRWGPFLSTLMITKTWWRHGDPIRLIWSKTLIVAASLNRFMWKIIAKILRNTQIVWKKLG